MNNVNAEIYVDISVIISMMPKEMKSKISSSFINFIENNKSNSYVSKINPKIPLKEQNIRKETKEMLGIIYRDYLCNDEERINMLQEEERELTRLENEKVDIYNLNNVFKNKIIEENQSVTDDMLPTVKNRENLFRKLINFIKKFFKI